MLKLSFVAFLCLGLVLFEGIVPRRVTRTIESVRLVSGVTGIEGQLEILSQGVWGTVCAVGFDDNSASVVCRSVGLTSTIATAVRSSSPYAYVYQSRMMVGGVRCLGNETSLNECPHKFFGQDYCGIYEGVGIICGERPVLPIDGVRLVGGSNPDEGRLEVLVNVTWGTVCGERFTDKAAAVVCRMLAIETSAISVVRRTVFGKGDSGSLVLLDKVRCLGTESSLNECELTRRPIGDRDCNHYQDVGIICTRRRREIEAVRLQGGPTERVGRVEVLSQGVWGTVCENGVRHSGFSEGFDNNTASVICSFLGFTRNAASMLSRGSFSPADADSPILLNDLSCGGRESSLNECLHGPFADNNCTHNEDVGIICACPQGQFGEHCDGRCGHCLLGNAECSNTNGSCAQGCDAGFHGNLCNDYCQIGTYGNNCEQQCGNCRIGDVCRITDGRCPRACQEGWTGRDCKTALADG